MAVPKSLRQYLSVCRRDFPKQGDVAPKVRNGSKTFMSKTIEGVRCSHTLGRTSIPFVIKVLGFLRGFFKIPLSRCGQSPRPLEPIGWWHLAARGSYSAVCRRDFPMQGDVAPKVWNCSKTFMSKTTEGAHCSHTLGRKPILIVIKVLGFLRGFFKIPLSRCGQSPRPLEPIGWWYLAARGSTFPSVDETFPCRVMSHPRIGTVAKLL